MAEKENITAYYEFQLTEYSWLPYNTYKTAFSGEKLCPYPMLHYGNY